MGAGRQEMTSGLVRLRAALRARDASVMEGVSVLQARSTPARPCVLCPVCGCVYFTVGGYGK